MSSYFLNSFSGRYPNGSDYQLLNYGTNGAMNASYRDSTSMHSGSFGYNYNGIDLSVNRPNNGHFGAVEDNSRAFQNPGQETRYRQSSCSLSSPDPMSCATSESLELKGSSPPSDQSTPTGNSRLYIIWSQIRVLGNMYLRSFTSAYLYRRRPVEMASLRKLTEKKIKICFQNRRMREKRLYRLKRMSFLAGPSLINNLPPPS
uniref:Homeobox B5b n=1 Tax=Cyprinus carpio TaxID=7962 RepID=A0A8C2E590_CYPCA